MTLPSPAGKVPKLSLDSFTGVSSVKKNIGAVSTSVPETIKDLDTKISLLGESTRDKSQSETPAGNADDDPAIAGSASNTLPQTAPLPPKLKPIIPRSSAEICDTLAREAQANDVPTPFFIRLLFQESRFKPGVISHAGAEGIAQFMPDTSARVGLENPFDPLQAIPAAARLLRNLAREFGNLGLAAAAYNAGPRRIQDWLAKKGKLPQETQGYVRTITGRAPETWTVAVAGSPALKLPRHAPCQEAAGLLAWNGPQSIPLPPVPGAANKMVRIASEPEAPRRVAAAAHGKAPSKAIKIAAAPVKTATAEEKAPAKAAEKPSSANAAKPVIVQVATAKHRHAHKEKVAQN